MEEAIKVADEITREGVGTKSIEGWLGLGEAGLVYDSRGCHVWSGITEYIIKDENEKMFRAIEFATKAHYGYFRKGGSLPYIIHPLGVARILIESGCINKVIIAGILHDVVEDTSFTLEDIQENFGEDVAGLVKCVTEPDKSDTWENRKRQKIEYLKSASSRVLLVACADKLDNIRAIRQDYAREGESLWSHFGAPKEKQKWYYQSLAEVFANYTVGNAYGPLFKEFISEVEAMFEKKK